MRPPSVCVCVSCGLAAPRVFRVPSVLPPSPLSPFPIVTPIIWAPSHSPPILHVLLGGGGGWHCCFDNVIDQGVDTCKETCFGSKTGIYCIGGKGGHTTHTLT